MKLRLLPSVMPFSVPLGVLNTVPSPLMSVPLAIVPVSELRPPAPKGPAEPISSVPPPRLSVPVRLTVLPAARVKVPRLATVTVPPRLNTEPDDRDSAPLLPRLVPLRVSVPPCASMLPDALFVQLVGATLSVPAVTRNVPLLVRFVGLIVSVCPAVLPIRVPLLTMVATLLSEM